MGRLNLIFNGMMIFDEDGANVNIIVPKIDGHVRQYFVGDRPHKKGMNDLNTGTYTLSGVAGKPVRLLDLVCARHYLCLKRTNTVDYTKARQTSAILRIPKPDIARLFRGGEPDPNLNVFGNTPERVAHRRPMIFKDIVVFSYLLGTTANVELKDPDGKVVATANGSDSRTVNWIVYSDEPTRLDNRESAHSTQPVNELLVGPTGVVFDFSLSAIGPKDGYFDTGIGMTRMHLCNTHELPDTDTGVPEEFHSGSMTCSGLMIGEEPGDRECR